MISTLVAVHVDDIFHSFRNGFADFIEAFEKDEKKRALLINKTSKHFVNMEIPIVNEFLASTKNNKIK